MSESIELQIERIEAFEERLHVRFESLFIAKTSNNHILINGELHTTKDLKIAESIELIFSAHNAQNSIVSVETIDVSSKTFLCFETFSCVIKKYHEDIAKVRIYPKQK